MLVGQNVMHAKPPGRRNLRGKKNWCVCLPPVSQFCSLTAPTSLPTPGACQRRLLRSLHGSVSLCKQVVAIVVMIMIVAGCGSKSGGPSADTRADGQALFRPDRGVSREPGAREVSSADAWLIVIVGFYDRDPLSGEPLDSEGQAAVAEVARLSLHKVQTTGGLPGAYLTRHGKALVLAYGAYPGHDSPRAQADLRRIQNLVIEGERPFAGAVLAPPDGADIGTMPEYDLRNVKAKFGERALYTLEIGVYSREDGRPMSAAERAEMRRLAEQAVVSLRREGEQAFYYHGPNRSSVTIGVFGQSDHSLDERGQPIQSLALQQVRQRHPHKMHNGRGMRIRVQGVPENDPRAWRIAPSALVAIPSS